MKAIFLLLCTFSFFCSRSQSDSLYVLFQNEGSSYIIKAGKHRNDSEPKKHYPFDGGSIYKVNESLTFQYRSHTPSWAPNQFEYKKVHISILEEKDFKDAKWFKEKTYGETINYFDSSEKVIYLIDESEIKGDSTYMVRVYFSHSAKE